MQLASYVEQWADQPIMIWTFWLLVIRFPCGNHQSNQPEKDIRNMEGHSCEKFLLKIVVYAHAVSTMCTAAAGILSARRAR